MRALARVNLAAVQRNVERLRGSLSAGAGLCAVVKADGYGHGAVPVARAALAGGARSLAVATASEAQQLRGGGVAAPIIVMGALSSRELPEALAASAELVAWDERFVEAVAASAPERAVPIHVKLDSGLGRLGTREPARAIAVAQAVLASPATTLAGAMTHLATADGDLEFVARQLEVFEPFARRLRELAPGVTVHAANSAATLRAPASHFDLVRCGIAVYGCDPMNEDPLAHGLEPALELSSYVAAVKLARPGDSAGYGRRWIADAETWLATLPIGYGDGVRRALSNNCEVLIDSRRYPVVGTVSMDNITVDLGGSRERPPEVEIAAPATLIGCSGALRQTAEELARRIGTISYEVVCGISPRVPRAYHRDGVELDAARAG